MAKTFNVKILVFFGEILGIYISEYVLLEYISFFTITLLQPASGYTKNPVITKKVFEKKGEIFLFFFGSCSPVYSV
jgi:hypothetical protein